MFCTKCGAEILNGNNFCTQCGNRISAEAARSGIRHRGDGLLPSKGVKVCLGVFAVVCMACGILGYCALYKARTKEFEEAKKFYCSGEMRVPEGGFAGALERRLAPKESLSDKRSLIAGLKKVVEMSIPAAKMGNSEAQFLVGICYEELMRLPFVQRKPRSWRQMDSEGTVLGYGYQWAEGAAGFDKAAKWFRKSAENGNRTAQEKMAFYCSAGIGVPKDMDEAAKWKELAKENTK